MNFLGGLLVLIGGMALFVISTIVLYHLLILLSIVYLFKWYVIFSVIYLIGFILVKQY